MPLLVTSRSTHGRKRTVTSKSTHGGGGKPKPGQAPKPKPGKAPQPKRTPKAPVKRKWSPGLDVACCAAEAFGALVTASGRPWSAGQTLALYWMTAGDPDAGASIEDTLQAAGCPACGWPDGVTPAAGASLILGVHLAEPHAIAVTPDGTWWSWGEPFDPAAWPELVVEEAWCLR